MCGIVAVLARPAGRPAPRVSDVLAGLDEVTAALGSLDLAGSDVAARAGALAERLAGWNQELRGPAGVAGLLAGGRGAGGGWPALAAVAGGAERIDAQLAAIEARLDAPDPGVDPEAVEGVNAALVRLRDGWWALARDRVDAARAVAALCPPPLSPDDLGPAALGALWATHVALAAIDRLEVRGRDSAGVHLLVAGHGLDLDSPSVRPLLERRADHLFTSMAVRTPEGHLSLVYKAAAEIGELGDNVRSLRARIAADDLLGLALAGGGARVTVLGHTRWASVGVVSEANAHPVNSDEVDGVTRPYVTAALNGDVDNHAELRLVEDLAAAPEITTDAKVIPALVARGLAAGAPLDEAFRSAMARFDGSVAIAASSAADPDRLDLALRGSGQALYVGLAEDAFVVASEPYGLVEETAQFLRMDGEATRGQVVSLHRDGAGTLAGMRRARYDGAPLPVAPDEVVTAEVTTRDIDRSGYAHFLLKEISEAPTSFRKTLRGKVVAGPGGRLGVRLAPEVLPADVVEAVASGRVTRVCVIGQGTAAVAGRAVADAFARALPGLTVSALPATELSGFGLVDDMADTLVVAISQSGTTTDTNRTVDQVRARRAPVLAVVNRRNSDLAARADGVLYTSDGRDVEVAVASTKAFYAQVAAGWLLALGLAAAAGRADEATSDRLLAALRDLPGHLEEVLALRPAIAALAAELAPSRRYWAVVGSGPDQVAAAEVRIKLSELCYRSIAADATEDKKHIDLSCEPLVLVCAGGLSGPNADDVAKEVAIYRAHKAAPLVIASAGEAERYRGACGVVEVPAIEPALAFVLAAMVGHLFGYEAAVSIDAQARPLRAARAVVEAAVTAGGGTVVDLAVGPAVAAAAAPFFAGLRAGAYDGNLLPSTAVALVALLRYVTAVVPIDGYELESGKVASPGVLVADLLVALGDAIDELTRPIDAIKHQAKTVTVGISRNEDALLGLPLVGQTLAAGASADLLGYRALRTLGVLDEAVEEVLGFTRYRIDGPVGDESAGVWPEAVVVDQGGVAAGITSRTTSDPRLRGSKHRAAEEREVTVVRGASDGRTVILVPEVKANAVTGLTLLHVRFADEMAPEATARVLAGYRGRYAALRDAVTETEPVMDDARLATIPLVDLLTQPVYVLARRWSE